MFTDVIGYSAIPNEPDCDNWRGVRGGGGGGGGGGGYGNGGGERGMTYH